MRKTNFLRAGAAVLAVWALTGLGCTQNPPTDIQSLKIPADFDYSTTQDVTVRVTVSDVAGSVSPGTEVVVGGTGEELVPGNIYTRGITNETGSFEQVVRIPARIAALRVQASIVGITNRADASIENNAVSVAFGPES
jgi:hypothetical protein